MQSSQPLVSIITPMFNSGKFLRETIESVLQQHYTNWELLLADDGSSDETVAIAKDYAARYPDKIFYTEHEGRANKGASATRNIAIAKGKGEFVALLDSDDVWKPDYLTHQVEFLSKHDDVEVVCEATIYWHSWSDASAEDELVLIGVPAETKYDPPQLATRLYPFGKGRAPCMCGILIRMAALRKIGCFEEAFTVKDQLYEDQAFDVKNYLHNVVYISSRANNIYRQRDNSLMHSVIGEGNYDKGRHFFLLWLRDYLTRKQINNPKLNALIWKAMFRFKHPQLIKYSDRLKQLF